MNWRVAVAWLVLAAAWPVVKAITWWDEQSIRDYEAMEREFRRD